MSIRDGSFIGMRSLDVDTLVCAVFEKLQYDATHLRNKWGLSEIREKVWQVCKRFANEGLDLSHLSEWELNQIVKTAVNEIRGGVDGSSTTGA